MKSESVHGYEIKRAVCFHNDRGFAFAENPKAIQPFVTWQFTDDNGVRDFFWGHYASRKESAVADYEKRIGDYVKDNPALTEKYNYLAAAEMSEEGNYNQIDGIINNVPKPSIMEQIKEYQAKSAESVAEKSVKQVEYER